MGKSILFVDDEPHILESLRRMLRPMRHAWTMRFADGGPEALELLRQEPCDVIVTDMRMPGMDGAELLATVRATYPDMIRIVLSGSLDQEMALRSVRSAHQYLAKPCDAESLRMIVERACAPHDRLGNETVKRVVSRIESLPSLPLLYAQILKEVSSPSASVSTIADIISQDLAMTAKVLQLVNSAFFGLPQRISSMLQAVNLLGLETVKALVLTVHLFAAFEAYRGAALHLESVWSHSLRVGRLAKAIAQETAAHRADDAFTAGLLHDVGKLILAANFPWEYRSIVEKAAREQMPAWEVESTVIGSTHADIGAYLMGIWGLPESIVEAIAFHHAPEGAPLKDLTPLSWVCFANRFAHGSVQGPGEGQTEAWLKICDGIEEDRGEDDDGGGIPLARRYTTS